MKAEIACSLHEPVYVGNFANSTSNNLGLLLAAMDVPTMKSSYSPLTSSVIVSTPDNRSSGQSLSAPGSRRCSPTEIQGAGADELQNLPALIPAGLSFVPQMSMMNGILAYPFGALSSALQQYGFLGAATNPLMTSGGVLKTSPDSSQQQHVSVGPAEKPAAAQTSAPIAQPATQKTAGRKTGNSRKNGHNRDKNNASKQYLRYKLLERQNRLSANAMLVKVPEPVATRNELLKVEEEKQEPEAAPLNKSASPVSVKAFNALPPTSLNGLSYETVAEPCGSKSSSRRNSPINLNHAVDTIARLQASPLQLPTHNNADNVQKEDSSGCTLTSSGDHSAEEASSTDGCNCADFDSLQPSPRNRSFSCGFVLEATSAFSPVLSRDGQGNGASFGTWSTEHRRNSNPPALVAIDAQKQQRLAAALHMHADPCSNSAAHFPARRFDLMSFDGIGSSHICDDGLAGVEDAERYIERRRRNNEAAKRCRANRRALFEFRFQKAQELEQENADLKSAVKRLHREVAELKGQLGAKKCRAHSPPPALKAAERMLRPQQHFVTSSLTAAAQPKSRNSVDAVLDFSQKRRLSFSPR